MSVWEFGSPGFEMSALKSKGGTGCQLVLPSPRYCEWQRETPEGARANPMGKRLHVILDLRYKLARRGGSACPRTPRLSSHVYVLQRTRLRLVIRFQSNFYQPEKNSSACQTLASG